MKIIYSILFILLAHHVIAQFIYKPTDYRFRKSTTINSTTISEPIVQRVNRMGKKVFQSFSGGDLDSKGVVYNYGITESNKRLDANTEIEDFKAFYLSRTRKKIFFIKTWRSEIVSSQVDNIKKDNTKIILQIDSTRREAKGISAQAIAGLYQKIDNTISGNANNFFELGSRLSDLRIKLSTKIRYELKADPSDPKKYILTRNQRSKYLYLDFISRGVLALDSLSTTVNEYINTLQGSPLSLRVSQQVNLGNPLISKITGKSEATYFLNFNLDARLIPVALGKEITSAGGSFHFIPTFTASFPAGKGDDPSEEDRFVIQASGNFAYVTDNAAKILYFEQEDMKKYSMSLEVRAGYLSMNNPGRNFNLLFKYNIQDVNGSKSSLGFTYAPQVVNPNK